jgi:hypothetical protein
MGSADVNAGDTILASQQNDLRDDVIDQFTAADEIFVGSGVDAGAVSTKMTQAQAEAGTEDVVRGISALRIAQAIAALESVSVQATQAAIEAETNENTYIPPDLARYIPGAAKAWCQWNSSGTIVSGSYNITSTSKTGTGVYLVTFNVDFSGTNYSFSAICNSGVSVYSFGGSAVAGSVSISFKSDSGTLTDVAATFVAFGDQ